MKIRDLLHVSLMLVTITISTISCKKESVTPPIREEEKPQSSNNALLKDPTKGQPFSAGAISDFTLASNGTDVALVVGVNSTGKVYAIDLQDNQPAAANAITSIANFTQQIAQQLGANATHISIENIEVNPISKSVYVLVRNTTNNSGSLFKVTNGNTISLVDLSNVSYAAITVFTPSTHTIHDMTWGDSTLFLSVGNWTLAAEIGKMKAPFTHNGTLTSKQVTNLFTHGSYQTRAPVEQMVFGEVNNVKRLMGVTTCAPGFSFPIDKITGTGTLDIRSYYDIMGGQPFKVIFTNQGNTSYLFDLHNRTQLLRIGQKYLDETQGYNERAKSLRDMDDRSPGLTDDDIKIYPGSYQMIAAYSATQLLVVTAAGQLSLLTI